MHSAVETSCLFYTEAIVFFFSKMVYVCFYLLGIFVNSSDNLFHVCLPLPVETFLRWLLSSSSPLIPTTPDACVCTYREWRVFHFLNLFFFLLLLSGFQLKPGCFRHSAFKTLNLV